jgi:hypothetical protein
VQAAIEYGEQRLRPDRPELGGRGEPVGCGACLRAGLRNEIEHRKVSGTRHTDVGVGGGDAPLGRRDVRTTLEQLRGEPGVDCRHGRQVVLGTRTEREAGRLLPDEDGDRVLGLRTVETRVLRLGARQFELRPRLLHIGDRCRAAFEEVLRELQRPFIVGDRLIEKALLDVQAAQQEVIGGELGVQRQIERGHIAGGRLLVRAGVGDGVAHTAEDVDLIGEVAAQHERVPGTRPSRCIALRVDRNLATGGGSLGGECRKPLGAGDAGLCTCLFEACQGRFETLVGVGDFGFEPIEVGIPELRPPASAGTGVGG